MDNIRTPKQVLFGELPSKRPCHGVKKRWRDIVLHDLKNMNVPEASWYTLAQAEPSGKQFAIRTISVHHTSTS
jgi:hypothetical protein